jgi:hypothetical protein
MKVDDRPTYVLTLRPEKGIDGLRATKALLKFALRKFGLRVVTIREEQPKMSPPRFVSAASAQTDQGALDHIALFPLVR